MMARIKKVLELVRRCCAQAKGAAIRSTKKDLPASEHADGQKSDATRGIEIIRAVFPNKN
jgi:hypothetical protein